MSPDTRDPWRELPTRKRFGEQLRDLEQASGYAPVRPQSLPWRLVAGASGMAAAIVCAAVILTSGHNAQANVINKAPAAAEHAGSVRFQSVLTLSINGHRRPDITEHGAIDFLTGAFVTVTRFEADNDMREQRSVNGILYTAPHAQHGSEPKLWYSARARKGIPDGFATESDVFTDPPAVFRALAHIKAPVRRIGPQKIEGTPTTIYRLSTDLATFLATNAGHIQDLRMYRGVRATLVVWIDRQGRPVRVQETFSSGSSVLSTTVRFSGYGQEVLVQPPPKWRIRSIQDTVRPNPLGIRPGLPGLLFFRAK